MKSFSRPNSARANGALADAALRVADQVAGAPRPPHHRRPRRPVAGGIYTIREWARAGRITDASFALGEWTFIRTSCLIFAATEGSRPDGARLIDLAAYPLTLADLAAAWGRAEDTVRRWNRAGLLAPAVLTPVGWRFGAPHIARLATAIDGLVPLQWKVCGFAMTVRIREAWGMAFAFRGFSCALTVAALAGCGGSAGTEPSLQKLNSMTISPPSLTIMQGDSAKFSANGIDSQLRPMVPPNLTWRSSNTSVATVDNSGMVRGIGVGSATMTATSSGMSASVLVVVAAPARPARDD
ncbi:MAG: Ig-like domain-containing protein [Gemmatimonadaceae bacterium]|nr:Ig-like domain-containing protein [Gemmatimonadaceae bacterium]